jgi:acyl transferase domain-containing protein
LTVSHAFHSPLMKPMLSEFAEVARSVKYEKARVGVVSNVTGAISFDEMASADYWCRHVLAPVDFAGGMKALEEFGCEALVEIGPKPTLLSLGKQCLSPEGRLWLPSLQMNRANWTTLLDSMAQLYVQGAAVDWQAFYRDDRRRHAPLPTYPFQHRRYWIEAEEETKNVEAEAAHPLLGRRLPSVAVMDGTQVWEVTLSERTHTYLQDHQISGSAVLPYAVYVEMALAAARDAAGDGFDGIDELELHHPVFIRAGEPVTLQLILSREHDRGLSFSAYQRAGHASAVAGDWKLCASAKIQARGDEDEVCANAVCQQ